MTTSDPSGPIGSAAGPLFGLALLLLVGPWASPSPARAACRAGECASGISNAAKKGGDEWLWDKVGLGSLGDLAWEAMPAALALSALIGAAGGFVYAGIVGGRRAEGETNETSKELPGEPPAQPGSDRPSP